MKIGVSGASGQLGGSVLAALKQRAQGHTIIGVSRTPEKVAAPAEGRAGDYDDPSTLAKAYAGLDRLLIIPSADMRPGQRAKQNVAAIDAAVAAGVGHVMFVSSCGTRAVPEPDVWASYFAAEQRLMRSAKRWSILRMNYYAEAFLQEAQMSLPHGVLAGIGESKVAFVSREDLALAAAGLLTGEGHEGAIYNATGPASLTGPERAAAVSAVSGKPFSYMALPEAAFRAGLAQAKLPDVIIDVIVSIQSGYLKGGFDIVTGDIEYLCGQKPRSLQQFLSKAMG